MTSLLETSNLMQEAMGQARDVEDQLRALPVPIIACIGALVLARAAWVSHMHLCRTNRSKGFRAQAHAMLADVLDEAELLMTETEGRA